MLDCGMRLQSVWTHQFSRYRHKEMTKVRLRVMTSLLKGLQDCVLMNDALKKLGVAAAEACGPAAFTALR